MYMRCSDVTVIYCHDMIPVLWVGKHDVLWEVGNRQNFIPIFCVNATIFRFVQLIAHQGSGVIISLRRKRSVLDPHYGGETAGIDIKRRNYVTVTEPCIDGSDADGLACN